MASKRRFIAKKPLKRGPNGHYLCRYCGIEVQPPKRTFCSEKCVHEWKLRRNGPYVRKCVFKRDKGICAICRRDTVALKREALLLIKQGRKQDYIAFAKSLGMSAKRRSWWDADHILPVAEGGGECDLSNIRSLCMSCHKKVTRQLARRLAIKRKLGQANKKKAIVLPPPESVNPVLYRKWQLGKL